MRTNSHTCAGADVRVVAATEGALVATFVEEQRAGARGARRRTTAVFVPRGGGGGGYVLRHMHESAVT